MGEKMKQKELTEKLVEASKAYYTGDPIMDDREFDILIDELKRMEEESGVILPGSPTVNVAAKVGMLKKSEHEMPALSLDKINEEKIEDLQKWLGDREGVLSWKMDGLTVVLTYDDGRLTRAVTRGDGFVGDDVTHNAVNFAGIPKEIAFNGHLVVRGEAVMTFAEFNRINDDVEVKYKNPRNLASSTVQMHDPNESKKRQICFYGFTLVTPGPERGAVLPECGGRIRHADREYDRIMWLSDLGFTPVEIMEKYKSEPITASNILEVVNHFKGKLKALPFPTDGLVLCYADAVYAESLGVTGKFPKGSVAFKWSAQTVTTVLRDIEWSVGKTGVITPVAVFDEVYLGLGSNVTRASLHNLSIMENMPVTDSEKTEPLELGAEVEVYLANMIIPQIASIRNGAGTKKIVIPDRCPVCGEKTHVDISVSGVKVLKCKNPECSARKVALLMNTFSKGGLFIRGLGESQIKDLLAHRLVDSYPVSFFKLRANTENDPEFMERKARLLAGDGWGEKSWSNLLDAIDAARKTTLQKFLYSLNVKLLGNDLSKKLSRLFNGDVNSFMQFVRSPDAVWLMNMDVAGVKKADNIFYWCRRVKESETEWAMLNALVGELDFEAAAAEAGNALAGKTFVITGAVHDYKNRDEFKASVEARGGKVSSSVSKNTSFLVNNDITSTSGKNAKAKELGIPIISEDEFIAKFGR